MTIQEYKNKFSALFKTLQDEHGKVECVHIENGVEILRIEGGFYEEGGANIVTNREISVEICF